MTFYAPKGYVRLGEVIRLRKVLYGLKQSPHQWFGTLRSFLTPAPLGLH